MGEITGGKDMGENLSQVVSHGTYKLQGKSQAV